MPIALTIDPQRVYSKSAQPHEPIKFASDAKQAEFAETVWQHSSRLFQTLTSMGYVGSMEGLDDTGVDFYMNHDAGTFRMLSVVIKSWRMVNPKLLPEIAEFLHGIGESYAAFLSCDIDVSTELFMIYVTSQEVVAAFETRKMAERFGFDPASGPIGPITLMQ
jgi:hypothetical protein